MSKVWPYIEAGAAAIGAGLGYFFGKADGFFIALICLMGADMLTGFIKGAVTKELSSRTSFIGIAKKALILLIVGLANILDTAIMPDNPMLRTAVIFFYLANEGLSIIENAVEIGLPVPEKIRAVLLELRKKGGGDDDNNGNGNGTEPADAGTGDDE